MHADCQDQGRPIIMDSKDALKSPDASSLLNGAIILMLELDMAFLVGKVKIGSHYSSIATIYTSVPGVWYSDQIRTQWVPQTEGVLMVNFSVNYCEIMVIWISLQKFDLWAIGYELWDMGHGFWNLALVFGLRSLNFGLHTIYLDQTKHKVHIY